LAQPPRPSKPPSAAKSCPASARAHPRKGRLWLTRYAISHTRSPMTQLVVALSHMPTLRLRAHNSACAWRRHAEARSRGTRRHAAEARGGAQQRHAAEARTRSPRRGRGAYAWRHGGGMQVAWRRGQGRMRVAIWWWHAWSGKMVAKGRSA
jgi:hypothetical protein